jgi:hypothetical protein
MLYVGLCLVVDSCFFVSFDAFGLINQQAGRKDNKTIVIMPELSIIRSHQQDVSRLVSYL